MAERFRGLYILVLVLLPALTAAQASHAAAMIAEHIVFRGVARSYIRYVPDHRPPGAAPLLVLLHGSGSDGARIARHWAADAEREGLVLVAPNALHKDAWRLRDDPPSFLRATIEAAIRRVPVDRRRLYLFGQSGGAVYALLLSMLESNYFAATAVHAGAWRTRLEYTALDYAQRKIPIAIIIGDRDEYFPQWSVRQTTRALRKHGIPIEVTVIPGQHHAYSEAAARIINPIAWTFLSRQRLDERPRFTRYR